MLHAAVLCLYKDHITAIFLLHTKITSCEGLSNLAELSDAGSLPHGNQLVIGLNPPFGKNNSLAKMFVDHAAVFQPAIIILIVPPATPIPQGYVVDYQNTDTMKDRSAV